MSDIEYARLITKSSSGAPTVPSSPSHDIGDWDDKDIYESELYIDQATGKLYTRIGSTIYDLNSTPVDTNLGNTNLTQTDTIRTYNIDGNMLKFDNGQVVIGTELGSPSKLEVVASGSTRAIVALSTGVVAINGTDNTGQGFQGRTVSGFGGVGVASGSGTGLYGQSVSGVAGHMDGGLLVETYALGSSSVPSSVATFNSTTKGILIPSMNTSQRNSIPSPATGLQIWNSQTARFEHWNGTYWAGQRNVINIFHGAWPSPANGQTYAFGAMPIAPQASGGVFSAFDIVLRGNGVIRACSFKLWFSGTNATGEALSLYVRHNSTDYLVATVTNTSSIKFFDNAFMDIPYVDGDTFKMIFVNAASGTRGSQLLGQGTVTTE